MANNRKFTLVSGVGILTFEEMRKVAALGDSELKLRFSGLPNGCKFAIGDSYSYGKYPQEVIDLINLGWPIYRFEDEDGTDWYSLPDDLRTDDDRLAWRDWSSNGVFGPYNRLLH